MTLSRRALGGGAAAASAAAALVALSQPRSARAAMLTPQPLVLGTCCPCELRAGTADELLDLDDDALDSFLLGGDGAVQPAVCDLTFAQVLAGARAGFTAFDTAVHYENEESVGAGLRAAAEEGALRHGAEVISKVWVDMMTAEGVLQSVERSAERVGAGSNGVSLSMLLHFPGDPLASVSAPAANRRARLDAWRGMEECLERGLVQRIGVANFSERHMHELLENASVPPAINQVECHPFCANDSLLKLCQEAGVEMQAASPFAHGDLGVLRDERLSEIAASRGITVAQLVLAWLLERGVRPVVGASTKAHQEEALLTTSVALPLKLDADEAGVIKSLDRGTHVGFDPRDIP